MFSGKAAPSAPGKKDLEAINAAIMQQSANAANFAQAYKVAREKAYGEFMDKLREFREKVLASKADAVKLQREALDFAEKNLPNENRGEFARQIVGLLEFSPAPSEKFPEGRRQAEFVKLLDKMLSRSRELRKTGSRNSIREMLDAAKIKRNYKGIPTDILPSERARVDRIGKIVDMNIPAVAAAIAHNNEQIGAIEEAAEHDAATASRLAELREDNALLDMFGTIDMRSPEEAEQAATFLNNLISGGKADFRAKLDSRLAELEEMRGRALNDAAFGKDAFHTGGDAERYSDLMLKHQSLGDLMRLVSGQSIQDFDNSVAGELYRKVEDATEENDTALRHLQEDFDVALREIAGVDGDNALSRMAKKGKFFKMLSEKVEKSGVFKLEYSRPVAIGKADFMFEAGRRATVRRAIPVEDYQHGGQTMPGARTLLKRMDDGLTVGEWQGMTLDDVSIAFLRQQLADYDAGVKASYELFGDEADDANFNRMLADDRASAKLTLFAHDPEERSSRVEVPLSQGAALQLWLTWEQDHYKPNMRWNGWTEESVGQLKNFIKPEVMKLGGWVRDYISRQKSALDAMVFDRYGAHLPQTENYFPAAFRGIRAKSVKTESPLGRGAGSLSINPNFLIARKFHLLPPDIEADAFSTFFGNQIEQAHFLAWGDTVRDMRGVYGSAKVQKAINDNFGTKVTENLIDRISTIARGGGQYSGEYGAMLAARLYRYWMPSKIAINTSSVMKQVFGMAAYMNSMPVKDFARNLAAANLGNREFREFVKYALNTDFVKNRMAGGLDRDLVYLMNSTRDSKAYGPVSDMLVNWGTLGTRWADAASVLTGGYAVWKYNYEQAKKSGMADTAARDAAFRAWRRATDETQQSGALKDMNYFQANQGLYRYLTAFMSNPIRIMGLEWRTIQELRHGDKKAASAKLAKQILINHVLVPTLMQFTNDIIRAGFSIEDWWDDAEFEDYFLAWLWGPFEGMTLGVRLIDPLVDYAVKRTIGRRTHWFDPFTPYPLVGDLAGGVDAVAKIFKAEAITEKEMFDGLKAAGDAAMAAGVADSRIGSVGAIASAIGAQGKRVAKWFGNR